MRLGRGFTAVARQVPRLAGLAGLCPAPLTARYARRRSRQGFALRPSLRAMRAGTRGDMRLGRGFTAVAQRVPRLAGLAGLCPAPLTARYARRALGGHAAWPGFYRRGTTSATARRSGRALPCTPSARIARRLLADMRLGRGFTAVAQQVPRLASLAGELPLGPRPPFPMLLQNTATFSRSHASYKGRNCRFSSGFPSESRFCS